MASAEVTGYFCWKKFPGKRLSEEIENIKTFFGSRWDSLSLKEQDEIIDDYFVDSEVRQQHGEEMLAEFPPSFPKLMIPSGEKIMVDENDLRTWRDAHSGPFSWKSKSQQDLTLVDFEPENLHKPPSRGKKSRSGTSESEHEEAPRENSASPQFVHSEDRWTREMLNEYRTHLEAHVSSKPTSRASSPLEEDNPAFEGSVVDVRGPSAASDPPLDHNDTPDEVNVSMSRSNSTERTTRSKSPGSKKVSFSKSLQKMSDKKDSETKDKLISKEKAEDPNAFCNPAMTNEWSTFVGQEKDEVVEAPVRVPVISEPPTLTIDRGGAESSVESTPDHTSKLLPNSPDIAKAETEEFLFVAVDTSETVDKADLRKSGFDFLDEW